MTADYYVAALPVEVMRLLAQPAAARAEPRLAGLDRLVTRWMNGILFYLDRDVPLVHGHAIYIDSAWALTSISQAQFWRGVDLERYGDGRVKGILSVDISDWQTPGPRTGKVAARCTREEIRAEVWAPAHRPPQRRAGAGARRAPRADAGSSIRRSSSPTRRDATNLEPLLINTAGSWADRPDARRGSRTCFLAADYVRTNTDLATMEGANEAARRAVNAILDAHRLARAALRRSARCASRPVLGPARALGRLRWRLFAPAPARRAAEGRRRRRARAARPARRAARSAAGGAAQLGGCVA